MEFTLDYLYDHLLYDYINDGITYHGTIDYVSSHFRPGLSSSLMISSSQEATIKPFVDEYIACKKTEPNLRIEDFYMRKTKAI